MGSAGLKSPQTCQPAALRLGLAHCLACPIQALSQWEALLQSWDGCPGISGTPLTGFPRHHHMPLSLMSNSPKSLLNSPLSPHRFESRQGICSFGPKLIPILGLAHSRHQALQVSCWENCWSSECVPAGVCVSGRGTAGQGCVRSHLHS